MSTDELKCAANRVSLAEMRLQAINMTNVYGKSAEERAELELAAEMARQEHANARAALKALVAQRMSA